MSQKIKQQSKRFGVIDGGNNKTKGPIYDRTEIIRCKRCGNTTEFMGYVIHNPINIIIEAVDNEPGKYDVVTLSYSSDKNTIEVATTCAKCSSKNLEFLPVKEEE